MTVRLRVVSKWRLALFAFVLLTAAFAAGWHIAAARASLAVRPARAHGNPRGYDDAVIVGPGDSLWAIARRFAPAGTDPRFAVYELRQRNNLDSASLSIGQSIALPPRWVETATRRPTVAGR
jgi:hypothetical protein